jgi:hypothetical protein
VPLFNLFGKKPIAERVGLPQSVGRDLIEWISLDDREARDYLETHLGLIRQESVAAIHLMIEEVSADPKRAMFVDDLRKKELILQTVYTHGGTRDVVRAVYREGLGV